MSTETVTTAAVSRPKITLLMVLCGIVGAASVGSVSAATIDDAVPAITVKYDPQALASDAGARIVYRRLIKAAEMVCPDQAGTYPFVSRATEACRRQAVARAVHDINNPRLAELSTYSSKSG